MTTNYTFTFKCELPIQEVYDLLIDVRRWWVNIYGESINGVSDVIGEEFDYKAGGGMHHSTQKLIESIPHSKIVWLVTQSNLSFLNQTNEWTNTQLMFELSVSEELTHVRFTHIGLNAEIECYDACSNGWAQYLNQLVQTLGGKVV